MQCSKHEDKESVAVCKKCRREMCAQCVTEGEKLIPKSGICTDCGKKMLQKERQEAKSDITKMVLIAIGFAVLYAIGAVVFVAGIKNAQAGENIIPTILMCIAGLVIAGLPFAIGGKYIAQERREAYERENGSMYYINIDERGKVDIVKDNTKMERNKLIGFFLGVIAGVIATPFVIIISIIIAIKNGVAIKNIDGKLLGISAPPAANNSVTESKN